MAETTDDERRYPAPPTGMEPPTEAPGPDGAPVALTPIAQATCHAYVEEFPDYPDRYGPPGFQWCVHDYLHILNWAMTLRTQEQFERELRWLARVLEARTFPLVQFARGIELLAETVATRPELAETAERIAAGAAFLRSRPSFLD